MVSRKPFCSSSQFKEKLEQKCRSSIHSVCFFRFLLLEKPLSISACPAFQHRRQQPNGKASVPSVHKAHRHTLSSMEKSSGWTSWKGRALFLLSRNVMHLGFSGNPNGRCRLVPLEECVLPATEKPCVIRCLPRFLLS